MTEIGVLLDEATQSLALLDAGRLLQLECRARHLRAFSLDGVAIDEAKARLRVFASVLRETDRGLRILRRVRGEGEAWGR